jgi:hypothetical protein
VHETFRVFGDRLADDDDVAWLLSRVKDVTREAFGMRFDDLMSRLREAGSTTIDTDDMRRCVFGDYMRGPATDDDDDDDGSGDGAAGNIASSDDDEYPMAKAEAAGKSGDVFANSIKSLATGFGGQANIDSD